MGKKRKTLICSAFIRPTESALYFSGFKFRATDEDAEFSLQISGFNVYVVEGCNMTKYLTEQYFSFSYKAEELENTNM